MSLLPHLARSLWRDQSFLLLRYLLQDDVITSIAMVLYSAQAIALHSTQYQQAIFFVKRIC